MPSQRAIIGLPCVGGKSKLAANLCDVIEDICWNSDIRTYVSACGGGGKDILSLNHTRFDNLIYNEIETPLFMLMKELNQVGGVFKVKEKVEELFKEALEGIDIGSGDSESSVKLEKSMRKLFKDAYAYTGEDELTAAAYGVILVFGSTQNNRRNILYASKNGKRDFYNDLYVSAKYIPRLIKIYEKAKNFTELTQYDCCKVIDKYKDCEKAFIYVDPPYWNSSNDYKNTFDFDKHIELTNMCADAKCKIMISMHEFGLAPYLSNLYGRGNWHMYELKPISHVTISKNIGKKYKQIALLNSSFLSKIELIRAIGTNKCSAEIEERISLILTGKENAGWCEAEIEWIKSLTDKSLSKKELSQLKKIAVKEFCEEELKKLSTKAELYSKIYSNMGNRLINKTDYRIDMVTEYVFTNFEINNDAFQLITVNKQGEYPLFRESDFGYFNETGKIGTKIMEGIPQIFLEKYQKAHPDRNVKSLTASIIRDVNTALADDILADVLDTILHLHFITSDNYDIEGSFFREYKGLDDESLNLFKSEMILSFKKLLNEAYERQRIFSHVCEIIRKYK